MLVTQSKNYIEKIINNYYTSPHSMLQSVSASSPGIPGAEDTSSGEPSPPSSSHPAGDPSDSMSTEETDQDDLPQESFTPNASSESG
jgi:hypothetical protein